MDNFTLFLFIVLVTVEVSATVYLILVKESAAMIAFNFGVITFITFGFFKVLEMSVVAEIVAAIVSH